RGGGEVAGFQRLQSRLRRGEERATFLRAGEFYLVEIDRLHDVDDAGADDTPGDEPIAKLLACGGRDEDAATEILGQSLDAAGEVDRVAQRAVLELALRAGVADLGDAAVDADSDAERLAEDRLPALVEGRQSGVHGEAGANGT